MNEMTSLKSMVSGEVLSWFKIMVFCCFNLLDDDGLKVGNFVGIAYNVSDFSFSKIKNKDNRNFFLFFILKFRKN